jgi:hypothetical protein
LQRAAKRQDAFRSWPPAQCHFTHSISAQNKEKPYDLFLQPHLIQIGQTFVFFTVKMKNRISKFPQPVKCCPICTWRQTDAMLFVD